MTQWGMLQDANLQTELSYPEGDDGVAARLVIKCRKSYVVILEHDLTANDLASLLGRKLVGQSEGRSRVAPQDQLKLVNKERRYISVTLADSGRWRLDREDGDHPEEWAAWTARTFAAENHRVAYKKGGVTVSLMFYLADWGKSEKAYLDVLQERLDDLARERTERLERRFTR